MSDAAPAPPVSTVEWSLVPRKTDGLVTRTIADETVVVPIRGQLAQMQNLYVLSPVGQHLWAEIDGARSLADLKRSLVEAYEVSEAMAESDLVEFFEEIRAAGLVQMTPGAEESRSA